MELRVYEGLNKDENDRQIKRIFLFSRRRRKPKLKEGRNEERIRDNYA